MPWTFYPAFIGTIISIVALSYLAWREHNPANPRTLSELAAENRRNLLYFRIVLWTCGILFAITVFWYISPRITSTLLVKATFLLVLIPELLIGVFKATKNSSIELMLHDVFSRVMGFGMWATAVLFAINLSGVYRGIEIVIAVILAILAILTVKNREKFLIYELPFIYLSHISILVAAVAVS